MSHEKPNAQTLSAFHWKIVLTAGMGFFTDAYDLFIIGIVTAILAPIWHLSIQQLALLNGAALIAAAIGAVFFGYLSDTYGRKKLYGYEVAILFVGAVMAAFSTSFGWLLISRVVLGFGIGGDYPSSAVIVSESANQGNRGFLVLLVFAMQALGLIVGPLLASLLLASNIAPSLVWRILLGLGAIPALSVFYLRRNIEESPSYLLTRKAPLEVSHVVHDLVLDKKPGGKYYKPQKLFSRRWLMCLIGTAGAWFLMDVALYGNAISNMMILGRLTPHAGLLQHTIVGALIFLICAVPGYYFAAKYVDRIGRKPLQYIGFFVMAGAYLLIAQPFLIQSTSLFLIVYGMSYFFINFGPNATTFLIPSEIYPTSIRARAHGISAAVGKVGAFVGVFSLPFVMKSYGLSTTMEIMAGVSFLGVFATMLIPEMKQTSLESVEEIEQS